MTKWLFFLLFLCAALYGEIYVGADFLFEEEYRPLLKGKKIGLISNASAVNKKLKTTFDLLKEDQKDYELVAIFAPEHGFWGNAYAFEDVGDHLMDGIKLFGLSGQRRRPTAEMLAGIDLLIFDIQNIGSRSYTYESTLYYCMEEAARHSIPLIVLDRPNPMGGVVVDGPLVEEKWRSFLGYVNVPYCHGMTIGELARLFNGEHQVGCSLTVVPMRGWKRGMNFAKSGLIWVPTSPQVPESDSPFFYPTTGLIGHCSLVNIGIGYTLPFKLVGAPWIDAYELAQSLSAQNLPGVLFQPFFYRPFFGKFKLENCQGVRIVITDDQRFLPMTTQYTIMGALKNLYPQQFREALCRLVEEKGKKEVFNKLNGNEQVLQVLIEEKHVIWKLRALCQTARETFLPIRQKYLLPQYS